VTVIAFSEPDETQTDLSLCFAPIVQSSTDGEVWRVTLIALAFDDMLPVGSVTWDNIDGQVYLIETYEHFRGRGVARAMWTEAKARAAQNGWLTPWFGLDRSAEGDALARALAEEVDDIPPPPPWAEMAPEFYAAADLNRRDRRKQ